MGLDVYLYKYDGDFDAIKAEEKAYEDASEALYKGWDKNEPEAVTKERDAKRDALRAEYGYVSDGDKSYAIWRHPKVTCIEKPSIHGDHLFKVGYWRSSYNGGGINNVLRQNQLPDLYEIAGVDDSKYEVRLDWKATRDRAAEAAKTVRDLHDSGKAISIEFIAVNPFKPEMAPKSEAEARELALDELANHLKVKKEHPDHPFLGGGFMNGVGHFDFGDKGLGHIALIPGTKEGYMHKIVPGAPTHEHGVYAVSRQDLEWYAKALDIVVETCDFVLGQPDPEHYLMHWSG